MKSSSTEQPTAETEKALTSDQPTENEAETSAAKPRANTVLIIILFILVIAIIASLGAGAYMGYEYYKKYDQARSDAINGLQSQLAITATQAQLDQRINPISRSVGQTDQQLRELKQGQQELARSTEKLFELYGRDENSWKLAEVEYLLSVSQHKLILENDFEGAAKTLDAASTRIAELADPGLLPVRVKISEEIAQLKSRVRPDLVGMTLLVSRLTQQVPSLIPGYQSREKEQQQVMLKPVPQNTADQPIEQRIKNFMTSLVTVKTSRPEAKKAVQTNIIDVTETLENQLKLTRWTLLERDASQYQKLMTQNIALFKEYYDLEDAANADFLESLQKLQNSPLKPVLPDISHSLRMLQQIQKQREVSPQQEASNG